MAKRVEAIRHIGFEDLGYFHAPLAEAGYLIRYHDVAADGLAATDLIGADLIVVLGGPMGVYEEDRFPFLAEEVRLIEKRIGSGKPILGICLGAQLIARAMGARVYPGDTKEIGFAPVDLTPSGQASPLGLLANSQPVLHWHGDTFDLPFGSDLLASTEAYRNQAFSAGPNVLALQFHLEAGDGIDRWLTGHADELRLAAIDPAGIREGVERHALGLQNIAGAVLTSWLSATAS